MTTIMQSLISFQDLCDHLTLPHSSASVERMFSQLNMIKMKYTNRLLTSSVTNRLLAKQAIARKKVPCYEWEPSRQLINYIRNSKCRQRYGERCSKSQPATLHPSEPDVGSDSEENSKSYPAASQSKLMHFSRRNKRK